MQPLSPLPSKTPISIVTETIWINAPIEKVYDTFSNLKTLGKVHPRIQNVQLLNQQEQGKGAKTRWTIFTTTGETVQWDEELIEAIPNQFLAFHSPPPPESPKTTGWIQLSSVRGGTYVSFQEIDYFPVSDPDKKRFSMSCELVGIKTYLETGRVLKYHYYPPSESRPLLLTATTVIDVPPQKVWDIITDVPQFVHIDPGVQKIEIISDIKEGLGIRSRWTVERPKGHIFQWEEEIVAWDPPNSYSFRIFTDVHDMYGTQTLTPVANGKQTRVEFRSIRNYEVEDEFIDRTYEIMRELLNNVKNYAERQ